MSALSAIVANEETELFVQVLAIVANNDTERFAQVFEFIAQRTQVTLDVAEQFFYKNHRDIVNTVLDLTIEVDLATTKKKTTSTSTSTKFAKVLQMVFSCGCAGGDGGDDKGDDNNGVWWVAAPKMFEKHWNENYGEEED